MNEKQKSDRVRIVSPAEAVPVYNCVVYVRKVGSSFEAKIANLSDVSLSGDSEREILQNAVTKFKSIIADCVANGDSVPIIDPPKPAEDETVRYVAVHL